MSDPQQGKDAESWSNRTRRSREQKRDTDATGKSAGQPAVTNYNGSSDNENKGPNLALEERIKQALLSETVMAALVKAIAESITGNVTQRVAESITEDVTQRVTESITEDVTQRVYDSVRLDQEKTSLEVKNLSAQVKDLKKQLDKAKDELDEHEQYSRRNCLRFYGLPENQQENTDDVISAFVKKELGIELKHGDIDRSHRLARRNPTTENSSDEGPRRPRSVIVKFATYNVRQTIFKAKVQLKGKPFYINESLTSTRQDLMHKAQNLPNVIRTWSQDGRITALTKNGKKVAVRRERDIERLGGM